MSCAIQSSSTHEVQLPYERGSMHHCQECEIHHKGNDAAHIEIRQNYLKHDEILQHLNARYVGPHQAVFRIKQYKMHEKSHKYPACSSRPTSASCLLS